LSFDGILRVTTKEGHTMNRKLRLITQTGLAVKTFNEQLDKNVVYKVRCDYQNAFFAVAISSTEVQEFDTELEARMVVA
jgi:hypothetical protein